MGGAEAASVVDGSFVVPFEFRLINVRAGGCCVDGAASALPGGGGGLVVDVAGNAWD